MAPRTKTSTTRKRKQDVLDDSGLTEADRRVIRRQQRSLAAQIDQSASLEELHHTRAVNNELFENVRYTREAVLDADNVNVVVDKFSKHAESLVTVARYDPNKLIQKIRAQCSVTDGSGSRRFHWSLLGREAGICFNAVPSRVRFWSFPPDTEKPARKPRQPRQQAQDNSAEETIRLRTVNQAEQEADADPDRLSATEKTMKKMKKTLRSRMIEEDGKPICAVKYLMNPKSFTQTVENIFNYSFMVKKGEGSIQVQTEAVGGLSPGVYVAEKQAQECEDELMEPTQAVISFTMEDWYKLCQTYEVEKGDLPHRAGGNQPKKEQREEN